MEGEVWTKRVFAPNELLLIPWSSQVKDTHLTQAANAGIGVPKVGRGAHPEANQAIALDGRGKSKIASVGSIDASEHRGSLYWLVTRTSTFGEANMTLESVTWQQNIHLTMPFKKQKWASEWSPAQLPTIPVMFNKKTIKENTLLMVFQNTETDEKKDEKKKGEKTIDKKTEADKKEKKKQ